MLNLNCRALISFSMMFLSAGCATTKSPSGCVKSEFIFDTAPFPSCHASTIAETKSGLIAAWFGGTAERNPDVCIYVSRNENGRWASPVVVADGVAASRQSATNRLPTWNPVLFQPKQGPLMLFYKVGPSPATWWGMLITSDDDGKTWSPPQRLPDGILGPIKNKPVQLANGDILCPSSVEGDSGWRVHFERTTDFGKTWSATTPVNDGKEIGAIQPSILFLGKEKLAAIGRTRNDKLFWIESGDSGKTWNKMTLLDLPNPNSGTDAVTLRDGRQLLVYNHNLRTGSNNKGRSPLNVALSSGTGVSPASSEVATHSEPNRQNACATLDWQAAMVLEDSPDAPNGFAYPAVIQTHDGLVHITYTWERKRIKHVVMDPKKLKLQPIVNGEWPKF